MLEGATVLLPCPLYQGYIRSAGSVGYDAFEELVALQMVPLCGEVKGGMSPGTTVTFTTTTTTPPSRITILRCCGRRGEDGYEHAPIHATLSESFTDKGGYARRVGAVAVLYLRAIDCAHLKRMLKRFGPEGPPIRVELDSSKTKVPDSLLAHAQAADITVNFDIINELDVNCFRYCSNVERLSIVGGEGVTRWGGHPSLTTIPDGFLSHCRKLSSFDTTIFQQTVTTVHNDFMRDSAMMTLNLSPLANVSVIGNGFLESCAGLKSLDMSPLSKVTSFGDGLLQYCSALETVKLPKYTTSSSSSGTGSGFVNPLLVMGDCCMNGCSMLKTMPDPAYLSKLTILPLFFFASSGVTTCGSSLTRMNNLTQISSCVFYQCPKLKSVDLSSLGNVTMISNDFLYQCKSLQTVDMSHMVRLVSIGTSCLAECKSLRQVRLPPLLPHSSIGDDFMSQCSSVLTLDVTPLFQVAQIGQRFLSGTGLSKADLSPLVHCSYGEGLLSGSKVVSATPPRHHSDTTTTTATTPEGVLTKCRSLTSVDLSHLFPKDDDGVKVTINNEFLSWCLRLDSVDLAPLVNVTTILKEFMFSCEGITSIDLSPLRNVSSIGYRFMCSCRSLTSIDLRPLGNVKTIGPYFFGYAKKLKSLDLSPLSGNLVSIGIHLFCNCGGLISREVANFLKSNPKVEHLDENGNVIIGIKGRK